MDSVLLNLNTIWVQKNDITIQFDFDAWSGTFEKQNEYVYIKIASGEGLCFNDHSISKDYIPDILKTGLDPETIDASFMSMATEIVEFDYDIFYNCTNRFI